MTREIFITNEAGPKVLYDHIGLIGKFKDTLNNVAKGDDGIFRRLGHSLWVMVLTEEDKIKRAKNYPGFGKMFDITTTEPVWNTLGHLKTLADPNAALQESKKIVADERRKLEEKYEEDKKQLVVDMERYGQLFSVICKTGGEFIKNADPVLIDEFKMLRDKLGIKEPKAVEQVTVE